MRYYALPPSCSSHGHACNFVIYTSIYFPYNSLLTCYWFCNLFLCSRFILFSEYWYWFVLIDKGYNWKKHLSKISHFNFMCCVLKLFHNYLVFILLTFLRYFHFMFSPVWMLRTKFFFEFIEIHIDLYTSLRCCMNFSFLIPRLHRILQKYTFFWKIEYTTIRNF